MALRSGSDPNESMGALQLKKAELAKRHFLLDALHITVLSGFAVAQPIYDLLGQNAEFFVAHRLGPIGIVGFAAALSLAIPGALILLELLLRWWSESAQRVAHLCLVYILIAATVAPLINKLSVLPPFLAMALIALLTALLAGFYARSGGFRSFLSVLSPSIIIFPALFLFVSPVSGLLSATNGETAPRAEVKNPVPIVFLILDEFEAGALLDGKGQIDSVRYPNFAAFSNSSLWFPNATSVWPETKRAVPAILTGLFPRERKAIPSVQSHPDNLFTWLRGAYKFNVNETLTNLCPSDICIEEEYAVFAPKPFLSDLSVIFLHIVLPPTVSKQVLPRMDTGWKGFATEDNLDHQQEAKAKSDNPKRATAYLDRGDRFGSFIQRIKRGDRNTLNFLHILLPHVTYTYLPSGATYLGGDTEGLLERDIPDAVWVNEDRLPALAYQRFLLQVGYVDKLLGHLIERLQSEGLYDDALVIITSDHGKSFRPGQPKRLLTRENAPDILHVPLFVKLPGQSQGSRDARYVSSIDILPTIADVIGAKLPWVTDGQSLIDPTFLGRDSLELKPLDQHRATGRYDTAELTSNPRLAWKIETFGSGTPLSTAGIRGRYSDLVGQSVSSFSIQEETHLRIVSDLFGSFGNVRPGMIPAHLQGQILREPGAKASDSPLDIAVAINGRIEATTQTTSWLDKPLYVSVMLPEPAFRNGANAVELFRIEETSSQVLLTRIAVPRLANLQIAQDDAGNEILLPAGGTAVPVRPAALQGYLDRVEKDTRVLTLTGWAVDTERLSPASSVAVFVDGKQVYLGTPGLPRPDLVTYFSAPGVRRSGFRFAIEKAAFGRGSTVRLFALSDSGQASELNLGTNSLAILKNE
jgi:hypothetical protein